MTSKVSDCSIKVTDCSIEVYQSCNVKFEATLGHLSYYSPEELRHELNTTKNNVNIDRSF